MIKILKNYFERTKSNHIASFIAEGLESYDSDDYETRIKKAEKEIYKDLKRITGNKKMAQKIVGEALPTYSQIDLVNVEVGIVLGARLMFELLVSKRS